MLNEEQKVRLKQSWYIDFSVTVDETRYRANVFYQRSGMEAVLRVIPNRIPGPEELLLPTLVTQLTDLSRGLVLVTGPTGSGKTTTLACLINLINQKRRANIITLEDPIEFLYPNLNSIVSQREIGLHTPDFSSALKYVLRQDPDVVLIGELRDLETIAAALTVAETGHLVFGTLHTSDAAQSIDRIVDVFPGSAAAASAGPAGWRLKSGYRSDACSESAGPRPSGGARNYGGDLRDQQSDPPGKNP